MEKAQESHKQMKENPNTEKDLSSTIVDHPEIYLLLEIQRLISLRLLD